MNPRGSGGLVPQVSASKRLQESDEPQIVCQSETTRDEQAQTSPEDRPAGALPPKRSLGERLGSPYVSGTTTDWWIRFSPTTSSK